MNRLTPVNNNYILEHISYTKKKGFTIALVTTILPIFLLITLLVIEEFHQFKEHLRLEQILQESAKAGLLEAAESLRKKAAISKENLCKTEIPPPPCTSNYWKDFLSPQELSDFIQNPEHQTKVQEAAESFFESHAQETLFTPEWTYPFSQNPNENRTLKIKGVLQWENQGLFYFFRPSPLKIESSASLPLL